MSTVLVKSYPPPEISRREVLRYAGAMTESAELAELLEWCVSVAKGKIDMRVCYREYPLSIADGVIDIGFARLRSADLLARLSGCGSVVVFAATVGIGIDRLILRYSKISPARALMLQSLGTERIESLCDMFAKDLRGQMSVLGKETAARFSPGYGDLSLELQRDIFASLDCPRRIGVSLSESLLMTPSKSVTAIIGVRNK